MSNTDNFFEVRRDIEAAVATPKALGYGALVLQGHSLGTAQVAFYERLERARVLTAPV